MRLVANPSKSFRPVGVASRISSSSLSRRPPGRRSARLRRWRHRAPAAPRGSAPHRTPRAGCPWPESARPETSMEGGRVPVTSHEHGDAYHPEPSGTGPRDGADCGYAMSSAMAVGGMIGGGIFSVLGVTIELAGDLAFACFVLAGGVAMLTARSYAGLARGPGTPVARTNTERAGSSRAGGDHQLVPRARLRARPGGVCLHLRALRGIRRPAAASWSLGAPRCGILAMFLAINARGSGRRA